MLDYFLLKTLTSKLSRQKEPKGYGNFKYFVRGQGFVEFSYLSMSVLLYRLSSSRVNYPPRCFTKLGITKHTTPYLLNQGKSPTSNRGLLLWHLNPKLYLCKGEKTLRWPMPLKS